MTDKTVYEMIEELAEAVERYEKRPERDYSGGLKSLILSTPSTPNFADAVRRATEAMNRDLRRQVEEADLWNLASERASRAAQAIRDSDPFAFDAPPVRRQNMFITDNGTWLGEPTNWGRSVTDARPAWREPSRTIRLDNREAKRFPRLFDKSRIADDDSSLSLSRAKEIAQPSALKVLNIALDWVMLDSSEHGVLISVRANRGGMRNVRHMSNLSDTVVEVELRDDLIMARLLWVKDKSQPKDYVLAVRPDVQSAKEAVASTWNIPERLFQPTQHT